MSTETMTEYIRRRVVTPVKVSLQQRPIQVVGESFRLPVVSGPTGSGKTYFMIRSRKLRGTEIGIYITAYDLGSMDGYETPHEIRDSRAIKLFKAAITRALRDDAAKKAIVAVGCPVFVVVDELGSEPLFLRAMCRSTPKFIAAVQECVGTQAPVELMAGGTGADGGSTQVGSLPNSCILLALPTNSTEVWEKVAQAMQSEPGASVVQELRKSSTAVQLATNPRVAAIMYKLLESNEVLWNILGLRPLPRAIKSILPIFLAQVANSFRGMNSMCNVDAKTTWKIYGLALKLIHFPDEAQPDQGITPRGLVVKYGVLVDRAFWAKKKPVGEFRLVEGDTKPRSVPNQEDPTKLEEEEFLYAPSPRYVMPPAQAQLFRLGYGFQPAKPSGEGFEHTLLQWLETLLLAASGGSLRAFLARLGHRTQPATDPKLKFPGVLAVDSHVKIEPKQQRGLKRSTPSEEKSTPSEEKSLEEAGALERGREWAKELGKLMGTEEGEQKAVVVLNGQFAAFADLIVLIPNVAVVLVQAKFYEQTTSFTKLDLAAELWKMGYEPSNTADEDIKAGLFHGTVAATVEPHMAPPAFREVAWRDAAEHLRANTPYILQGGLACKCDLCSKFSASALPHFAPPRSVKHLNNQYGKQCSCELCQTHQPKRPTFTEYGGSAQHLEANYGGTCACVVCKKFLPVRPNFATLLENHVASEYAQCQCGLCKEYAELVRLNFVVGLKKEDAVGYRAARADLDRLGLAACLDAIPQCQAWKHGEFGAFMRTTAFKHAASVVATLRELCHAGQVFWGLMSTRADLAQQIPSFPEDVMFLPILENTLAPLETPKHPKPGEKVAFKIASDTPIVS